MIAFHDVHKTYPMGETRVEALRGVSVEIPRTHLTAIMGPSGSGKSTMLHLAGCLDTPTSGRVTYDGQDLGSLSSRRRAEFRATQVGFVFQKFNLIPNLSTLRNVELPLLLRSEAAPTARKKALHALTVVGLTDRSHHRPTKLSGGEQQRVAIARAIAHRPSVLFADEPTGELDTNTSLRVVKIFKDLIEAEGVTIVMTTHDTGLMEIGDRVYEIEDGEIVHADHA